MHDPLSPLLPPMYSTGTVPRAGVRHCDRPIDRNILLPLSSSAGAVDAFLRPDAADRGACDTGSVAEVAAGAEVAGVQSAGKVTRGASRMLNGLDYPFLVFVLSFVLLWLSARIGARLPRKRGKLKEDVHEDFSVVLGATLTLLGLIIGFSFSMAISRYDQRKNYEEAEANAIGTEYVRADLLPAENAAKVRALLRDYVDQRVLFYTTRGEQQVRQINARTAQLQTELWSAVLAPAAARPTPIVALVVSGMNDVLNSQGYTQAAWWNRIPVAAWVLMAAIAVCCNVLIGYDARAITAGGVRLLVLPAVVSISFFLIADIDSPRGGVIRVKPQNLVSLTESLRAP